MRTRLSDYTAWMSSCAPLCQPGPWREAYQAMRGASFLVAEIFAAEIEDVRRFDTPPQLMAFLGLFPRERSTGDTVRRSSLTLAGNRCARAPWSKRHGPTATGSVRP